MPGRRFGQARLTRQPPPVHALHRQSTQDRYLLFSDPVLQEQYADEIYHRAIGVVYNPQQERYGNYVPSVLSQRYDAFIYLDQTQAVHPLHMHPHSEKMPDTYPFGY